MINTYRVDSLGPDRLTIRRGDARRFYEEHHQGQLAENNFLEELELEGKDDEMLVIERPYWEDEGSMGNYDNFLALLALTRGSADLILHMTYGEPPIGLRVRDGKVEEKEVKVQMSLSLED